MGFKRKRKLYLLDFEGTTLEGLEMVMHGMTVDEALKLSELQDLDRSDSPVHEKQEVIRELFAFVASKVDRWNLEDDNGIPIKPSSDEFMSWDAGEAFNAIKVWQEAVQGVDAPLERPSSGGKKWVGPPIPMEIPSPNLPH